MLDDEPNVLAAYRRTAGRSFDLTCADSGRAALTLLEPSRPFAVIVTDMRMPEMNGLEFILAAKQKTRDVIFVMLTGNADQQTAINAINNGQVFRFLNKPCSPDALDLTLKDAVRQHELITAERVLLRDTLAGSVKLLIDALEVASPLAFGLQSGIKRIQQQVSAGLGTTPDWQLGLAATLCLIGLVAVPQLRAEDALTDENLALASRIGSKLVRNIPRLLSSAVMISQQRDHGMLPDDLTAKDSKSLEQIGSRVLRFSIDLAREEKISGSREVALRTLEDSRRYDNRLVKTVTIHSQPAAPGAGKPTAPAHLQLKVAEIRPGMVLAADLLLTNGKVFLSKGQAISDISAMMLEEYSQLGMICPVAEVLPS